MYRTNPEALRTVHEWCGMFRRTGRVASAHRHAPGRDNLSSASKRVDATKRLQSARRSSRRLRRSGADGPANETPDGVACRWCWSPTLAAAGIATWAATSGTSSHQRRRSRGPGHVAAANAHLLYRLSETPEGTLITFRHMVVGPFPDEYRPRIGFGMGRPARPRPQGRRIRCELGGVNERNRRTSRRARTGSHNHASRARADSSSAPVVGRIRSR